MFVSHDKNVNKKKFQKPNILRRKSKIPSVKLTITTGICESPQTKSLLAPISESKIPDFRDDKVIKIKSSNSVHNVKILPIKTNLDNVASCGLNSIEGDKIEITRNNTLQSLGTTTVITSHEENQDQCTLNVESFLVSGTARENITLLENDIFHSKIADLQGNQKWCLGFTNNTPKLILEECEATQLGGVYLEQKSNVVTMVPLEAVSSVQHGGSYVLPAENMVDEFTIQKLSVDQLFSRTNKFKCEVADCNKEFMSEQKLNKHKNVHNKDGRVRVPRQTTAECPVKNINEDGTENSCGMVFQKREDLLKHLKEEHRPEDAIYRCEECGRRFFWASGLRGHARAHRSRRPRAALACPWPGCGRVFRQPCRLREHSRAHTGDKPYPCRYPNCGWSFRTASKLMRHARRHTGERRHACAACGRAFLRREHLRDHARRHGAARRACSHDGCEQTFSNASSLYLHMKKFHKKEEENYIIETTAMPMDNMVTFMPESPDTESTDKADGECDSVGLQLHVCAAGEACADAGAARGICGGEAGGAEGRAARTHCTWPLPPRAHAFQQPDEYALEEDAQVEHSEISENNIYTVRSDLFLHGNVLTNEDSEHMAGGGAGAAGGGGGGGGVLDAELLLAPSVDIAQEELYADAADESAFRVFLLSGEELT